MSDETFIGYADMDVMKQVRVPISGIRILHYLDEDGRGCFTYVCDGDRELIRTLGILDWTKHDMLTRAGEDD